MQTTGKVRYIGTSSMYAWQFTRMLYLADRHAWTRFVSMQNLVPHSVVVVKAFWASLLYWSPIADNTAKNDEYLPTPISQELVRILRERFHNGPVFFPTNFRKAFRAACVKVGLGLKTGFQEWQYEGLVRYDRRRSIIRMQELMIPSP